MNRADEPQPLLQTLAEKLPDNLKRILLHAHNARKEASGADSTKQSTEEYGQVFDEAWRKASKCSAIFGTEMTEVQESMTTLTGLPAARRRTYLLNQPRLHTMAVATSLLRLSWDQRSVEPESSEQFAQLALEVLDRLDQSPSSEALMQDLHARAWGQIGNARRIQSDLQGADEALNQAYKHLPHGSQDPLEKALIDHWTGGLRRDQRKFDEAIVLLERACREYRQIRDDGNHAQALISLGYTHREAGDPERGLSVMRRAEKLLTGDQSLLLYVRHNQIYFLIDLDRYDEAEALLTETRPLYAHASEPLVRLRLPWVEGRIAKHTGRPEEAEYLFQKVRQGFIEHGIAYDAALVSLELAEIYVQQGRNEELKELAQEMVTVFRSRNVERETLAALLMLRHAASAERATLHVIRDIAARLRERAPQALTPLSPGDA